MGDGAALLQAGGGGKRRAKNSKVTKDSDEPTGAKRMPGFVIAGRTSANSRLVILPRQRRGRGTAKRWRGPRWHDGSELLLREAGTIPGVRFAPVG